METHRRPIGDPSETNMPAESNRNFNTYLNILILIYFAYLYILK